MHVPNHIEGVLITLNIDKDFNYFGTDIEYQLRNFNPKFKECSFWTEADSDRQEWMSGLKSNNDYKTYFQRIRRRNKIPDVYSSHTPEKYAGGEYYPFVEKDKDGVCVSIFCL